MPTSFGPPERDIMALQEAPSQPQNDAPEDREVKPGRVDEYKTGKRDPFTAAFNAAKDEIEGTEKPEKSKAKPKEKPAPKREERAEEAEPEKKPARAAQKPVEADDDEEAGEDADEEKPAPERSKGPVEPKKFWSEKRKEAFRFQPREVQEAWLNEDPAPNERWPTEIKEQFATLPREAKEILLTQLNEADKGLGQKFQALAAERKLAEDIKAAVPAYMRAHMQQRGLSEPQVFAKLMQYQHQAMTDPKGYVRQFIIQNKLNPAEVLGVAPQDGQTQPAQQADVTSHPAYQSLRAEYDALRQTVEREMEQRKQEENRRFASDFESVVSETDADGNSLYPYIRLLADPMARIIESDPEHFGSMGVKDRFATAYRLALEEFPELTPPKRTAKPQPADERDEAAHAKEEEKRAEKLERALTPKSRTPQPTPKSSGKTGDPFEDAWNAARKQLGHR